MGHQSYVLLCTETTLSNHPVVHPISQIKLRRPSIKKSLVKISKQFWYCELWTAHWIQDSIWLHCVIIKWSRNVKKILPIGRIWSKIWSQHCRRNIWNLKFNFILQKIFKIKIFRLVDFTIFFKLLWLTNFSFIKIICF